jgi:hypothetical protein
MGIDEIIENANKVYNRNRYFTCKETTSGTQGKLMDVLVLKGSGVETTVLREDFMRDVYEFNNPPKKRKTNDL